MPTGSTSPAAVELQQLAEGVVGDVGRPAVHTRRAQIAPQVFSR